MERVIIYFVRDMDNINIPAGMSLYFILKTKDKSGDHALVLCVVAVYICGSLIIEDISDDSATVMIGKD